jgi:hypothetical protein
MQIRLPPDPHRRMAPYAAPQMVKALVVAVLYAFNCYV